jgi:hypothetical protein
MNVNELIDELRKHPNHRRVFVECKSTTDPFSAPDYNDVLEVENQNTSSDGNVVVIRPV